MRTANASDFANSGASRAAGLLLRRTGCEWTRLHSRKKAQKAQKGFYTTLRCRRSRSFTLVRGVRLVRSVRFTV